MDTPAAGDANLAVIEKHLNPGEKIVWHGAPSADVSSVATLPIFVLMTIFWVTALGGVTDNTQRWVRPGVPAVVGLVCYVFYRITVRTWLRAKKTIHAVTTARLVSVSDGEFTSLLPDKILTVERKRSLNGHSTLVLVTGWEPSYEGDLMRVATYWRGIENGDVAENAVRALILESKKQ